MNKPAGDLKAVRTVVNAVQSFDAKDQQRIFRWAAEKLALPPLFDASQTQTARPPTEGPSHSPATPVASSAQDIKSFVAQKNPRSDVQFAATIAYYYQFVAPE